MVRFFGRELSSYSLESVSFAKLVDFLLKSRVLHQPYEMICAFSVICRHDNENFHFLIRISALFAHFYKISIWASIEDNISA